MAESLAGDIAHRDRPAEDVHIVPMGWERDRVVLPFTQKTGGQPWFHAHRIYLLVPNPSGAKGYPEMAKEDLDDIADVKLIALAGRDEATGKKTDFEQVSREVARICSTEIAAGNRVHINISTGSKLAAFAAGLAGMAYVTSDTGSIYYVEPIHYPDDPEEQREHGIAAGMKDIKVLEPVRLHTPSRLLMLVLGWLHGEQDDWVKAQDITRFLIGVSGSGFERNRPTASDKSDKAATRADESRLSMMLLRQVLRPLHADDLVNLDKRGRDRYVRLTAKGRMYARLAPAPEANDYNNTHDANV